MRVTYCFLYMHREDFLQNIITKYINNIPQLKIKSNACNESKFYHLLALWYYLDLW